MNNPGSLPSRVLAAVRIPRVTLFILAGWSVLAALTQVFVNSPLFLDIHDAELDGALGGLALSFNAVPLAVLYVYCARDPVRYHAVFWLALVHQGAMAAGNLYELAIGTYSVREHHHPARGRLCPRRPLLCPDLRAPSIQRRQPDHLIPTKS